MIKAQTSIGVRRGGVLGESGAALVEFALLAPVLLLIMVGIAQFGISLNQYVMLWNGVGTAAMQFAITGGAVTNPATYAWKAMTASAPSLTTGGTCTTGLCLTLTVNGTACATNLTTTPTAAQDTACNNALTTPANIGNPAVVSATYPVKLTVMGISFVPTGTVLTATISELVQ